MFQKPNGISSKEAAGITHIDGLFSYAVVLTRNRSDAEDLGARNLRSCNRGHGKTSGQ